MKIRGGLPIGLAAVGTLTLTAPPTDGALASAPEAIVHITDDDEEQARDFLSRYGVPEATQDTVLEKIRSGEPLLTDDPAATPTRTVVRERNGSTETIRHFADGSVSATSIEAPKAASPKGTVDPMAITGCTVARGSGYVNYTNCKVAWQNPIWHYWATTSFTLVTGGRDTVNVFTHCTFGRTMGYTVNRTKCEVSRPIESAGGAPAEGIFQFDATTNGPINTTHTRTLGVRVGGDTFWQWP